MQRVPFILEINKSSFLYYKYKRLIHTSLRKSSGQQCTSLSLLLVYIVLPMVFNRCNQLEQMNLVFDDCFLWVPQGFEYVSKLITELILPIKFDTYRRRQNIYTSCQLKIASLKLYMWRSTNRGRSISSNSRSYQMSSRFFKFLEKIVSCIEFNTLLVMVFTIC